MIETGSFFLYPFFWIFLSALFFGAGISRATYFIKKNGNTEKAKNRKWIHVCIFFSFSIIFAMCALLVPESKQLADIKYLYVFLIFTLFSFLGFRFKKAFGIPFLFLFIFSIFVILLFFQALTTFTGETEIAKAHVLSVKGNTMTMELVLADKSPEILDMKGEYFGPVINVIILDDFLVFSGVKTLYRFAGLVTFSDEAGSEILKTAESFEFQQGYGILESIYNIVEKYEKFIPGIKSAQREVIQKRVKKLTSYSIRVQNDGGVIVEEIE